MKKIGLKFYIIILFLLPQLLPAAGKEGKYKKTKVIQQIFNVDNTGKVMISNEYGNINVVTWQENKVVIVATVNVDGNDVDKVRERLDGINVYLSQNGTTIRAKTEIKSLKSSWSFFGWHSSNNTNFKINYEIKMPPKFDLTINNDYGNIYVDRLEGKLDLNADYGHFELGELLNEDNRITTDYFKDSQIEFIKNGRISADYSRIHITDAYNLSMNCDYSKILIDKAGTLKFNNDYGSINIKRVDQVNARGDYQTRIFGMVTDFTFSGDYGSLKIESLDVDFKRIILSSDYTNVKIYNPNQVAYRFSLSQDYGCFKKEGLSIYKEIVHNGDRDIEGYYKNRNAEAQIKVKMDYGCLKIVN